MNLPAFEPDLHISPFRLFRWLHDQAAAPQDQEGGTCRSPWVVHLEEVGEEGRKGILRLVGSKPDPGNDWRPAAGQDIVFTDQSGDRATARALALREGGHHRVRALYGGLELYDFALDPEIVGPHRHLTSHPLGP